MFAETLLLGRVRSADERRRALEIIDREARRLGALVETVLQFSRAERGSVHLAPSRVELAPLVAGLVRELEPLLAAAGVGVRLAVAADPVAVVDEDALRQMLLNLLDNAVRHGGRDRGEVMVELGTAGDRVYLAVDDAGPGIPAAERERIWEPFYRGAAPARVGSTGTGIGLAVVRDLVERHGGEVRVEESRRGGARFVVELPGAGVGGEARP
jgi:signal transduction histidine kinase